MTKKFNGIIKIFKTTDGAPIWDNKNGERVYDKDLFKIERYSLEKSFNNAHRWGINCEIVLTNENKGVVDIIVHDTDIYGDEQNIDIDDLKILAEKVCHYDNDRGTTSEIINIDDRLYII